MGGELRIISGRGAPHEITPIRIKKGPRRYALHLRGVVRWWGVFAGWEGEVRTRRLGISVAWSLRAGCFCEFRLIASDGRFLMKIKNLRTGGFG